MNTISHLTRPFSRYRVPGPLGLWHRVSAVSHVYYAGEIIIIVTLDSSIKVYSIAFVETTMVTKLHASP